jgi:hypothetical protein
MLRVAIAVVVVVQLSFVSATAAAKQPPVSAHSQRGGRRSVNDTLADVDGAYSLRQPITPTSTPSLLRPTAASSVAAATSATGRSAVTRTGRTSAATAGAVRTIHAYDAIRGSGTAVSSSGRTQSRWRGRGNDTTQSDAPSAPVTVSG